MNVHLLLEIAQERHHRAGQRDAARAARHLYLRRGCQQYGADAAGAGCAHAGQYRGHRLRSASRRQRSHRRTGEVAGRQQGRSAGPAAEERHRRKRQIPARSHEYFAAVHSPADRDFAADGRDCCWWASWPTGSCRFRRCRRSTTPPSRLSRSIPEPAPTSPRLRLRRRWSGSSDSLPGLSQMTSSSSFGASVITLQFNLDENIDVAEQEVQAAINAAQTYSADRSSHASDLQQGQSGRRANSDAGADLRHHAAAAGRGSGRHHVCAEDLAASRRRTGQHQRRTEARGAHPGQSDGAGFVRHEPGAVAHGASAQVNVDQAKGQLQDNRLAYTIGANDQLFDPQGSIATPSSPTRTALRSASPMWPP